MHSQGCEKTGDWVAFRKENEACPQRFFAPPHFFNSPAAPAFCGRLALTTLDCPQDSLRNKGDIA